MNGFEKDDALLTPPMLIWQISRMHRCLMRQSEPADGIMAQNSCRSLMFRLTLGDGVTQLELANDTRLKPPTVSVSLKRLEADGYIRRETDKSDLRAVRVYLTEKGRELERINRERLETTDARMMEGLSEEEAAVLKKLLLRVRDNMADCVGKTS